MPCEKVKCTGDTSVSATSSSFLATAEIEADRHREATRGRAVHHVPARDGSLRGELPPQAAGARRAPRPYARRSPRRGRRRRLQEAAPATRAAGLARAGIRDPHGNELVLLVKECGTSVGDKARSHPVAGEGAKVEHERGGRRRAALPVARQHLGRLAVRCTDGTYANGEQGATAWRSAA